MMWKTDQSAILLYWYADNNYETAITLMNPRCQLLVALRRLLIRWKKWKWSNGPKKVQAKIFFCRHSVQLPLYEKFPSQFLKMIYNWQHKKFINKMFVYIYILFRYSLIYQFDNGLVHTKLYLSILYTYRLYYWGLDSNIITKKYENKKYIH